MIFKGNVTGGEFYSCWKIINYVPCDSVFIVIFFKTMNNKQTPKDSRPTPFPITLKSIYITTPKITISCFIFTIASPSWSSSWSITGLMEDAVADEPLADAPEVRRDIYKIWRRKKGKVSINVASRSASRILLPGKRRKEKWSHSLDEEATTLSQPEDYLIKVI